MGLSFLRAAGQLGRGLALALGLGVGLGCSVADGPELLQLSSAGPGLVEPGGTLVITGRGFPAGRAGSVQLRGVGLVPGRDPARLTVPLSGHAASSGRVVVRLGEADVRSLTAGAPHATFRGRLELGFEPVRPGAPALRGHLDEVTLDVLSPGNASGAATDFPAFLGIELGADLSVVKVAPGLEAEAAGLRIGDRLHRLDGVRLLTLADFAPRQHGTTSLLEYSRPGYAGRGEVLVARAGYFRTDESTTWLIVSIGLAVLLGLLLAARPPRMAVWLLQTRRRLAPRMRSGRGLRAPWLGSVIWAALGALGVAGLATSARTALPLELPLLGGACLGAFLLATLLMDGTSSKRGFSLGVAFWGAASSFVGLLPVTIGWGLAAVEIGSLSLRELAASQAASPLGLGLLSSPWALVAGITYLLALVPLGGQRPITGNPLAKRAPAVRALEQFALVLGLDLWLVIYGGPLGLDSAPLPLALAVTFVELLLLLGLVRGLRTVSGRVRRGESWGVFSWPVVGLSLLFGAARLLSLRLELFASSGDNLRWLPLALGISAALWLGLAGMRSLSHHGRRADPWL